MEAAYVDNDEDDEIIDGKKSRRSRKKKQRVVKERKQVLDSPLCHNQRFLSPAPLMVDLARAVAHSASG